MERIRREVLEKQVVRIAALLGKPSGDPWMRVGEKNVAKIGTLFIDYISCYGGYRVAEMLPRGGEGSPFGGQRLKAPAFWSMLNGIERALEIKGGR